MTEASTHYSIDQKHLRLTGMIHYVFGFLVVLSGVAFFYWDVMGLSPLQFPGKTLGIVLGAIGVVEIVFACGLRKFAPWALTIGIPLCVVLLAFFPFGTLLGAITLTSLGRKRHYFIR